MCGVTIKPHGTRNKPRSHTFHAHNGMQRPTEGNCVTVGCMASDLSVAAGQPALGDSRVTQPALNVILRWPLPLQGGLRYHLLTNNAIRARN